MADAGPPMTVAVSLDASAVAAELRDVERLSRSFGAALGDALQEGVVRGNSLGDVLRSLGTRLSSIALSAALRPVENAFGSIFSGLTRGALGGVSPLVGGGLAAPRTLGGGLLPTGPLAAARGRSRAVAPAAERAGDGEHRDARPAEFSTGRGAGDGLARPRRGAGAAGALAHARHPGRPNGPSRDRPPNEPRLRRYRAKF